MRLADASSWLVAVKTAAPPGCSTQTCRNVPCDSPCHPLRCLRERAALMCCSLGLCRRAKLAETVTWHPCLLHSAFGLAPCAPCSAEHVHFALACAIVLCERCGRAWAVLHVLRADPLHVRPELAIARPLLSRPHLYRAGVAQPRPLPEADHVLSLAGAQKWGPTCSRPSSAQWRSRCPRRCATSFVCAALRAFSLVASTSAIPSMFLSALPVHAGARCRHHQARRRAR